MTWAEFTSLLRGLGEHSPLARVVQIRLENDPDMLKHFTPNQHRMRNEWQSKHKIRRSEQELSAFLHEIQSAFAAM